MKFYQVIITLYRYDLWSGKWKTKEVFPSPVIFESKFAAEIFKTKYPDILRRRGWKLKEGTWECSMLELYFEPPPKYIPSPELMSHYQNMQNINTPDKTNKP